MMHVTLRQLQTFEAVARLKSFSRAAEEMHVTQPTVSKQIRLLHEQVGLLLLDQLGKKIFLTEAGQELYLTCSNWLDTWNRFEQTISNIKGLKQGRLKIAAVTTTKYFMPRVLGPFCAQYPGIDIAMEVVNRDRLLERLARNQDDLYIMGLPPDDLDVESEAFMENPLVVIAPVSHPLAQRKRIPFAELANETFLMREQGSGTRIAMEKLFQKRKTPIKIKMELGSNEAIKQAVAGGLGLAMLSRSTLNPDPRQEELAVLDAQGFPIMRAWHVVRPKGKDLSVVATTFLDFLRAHIKLLTPRLQISAPEYVQSPENK
ncbi:LysR family transcriptional regulator [Sulfurirhabdus autotrophica]|uniref:DNA-binding transcriptional LysR family regulator n=1 Tax=Sulfurirhabdus autotrophica TaxID=1706046 RepID=A0A4R3Y1K5_9PROT|nr:LysR family transcriptional regulator [Sulfurirhabdus autotrophica]TCV85161.1 DNA-binding transcriptional LysR family regulator [Sulfurirhabdus autotrophica]